MTGADPQALIVRLIEAGTPSALVADVAMALARHEQERARRVAVAARQAKSRAKAAAFFEPDAGECDGHAASPDVTPPPPPDKESSPRPPKEINPLPVGGARGAAPARGHSAFPRPDFADPQAWRDFLANRRTRGMTNSASTWSALMAEIERIADEEWPPGRLIAHAAAQGWARIYDPRLPHKAARSRSHGASNAEHGRSAAGDAPRPDTTRPAEPISNPRLRAAVELATQRADRDGPQDF